MKEAERLGAIPFDFPGVELGHHGKECSFDAVIRKYKLSGDPALVLLSKSSMGRTRTTLFTTSRRVRGLRRLQRGFVIWDSGMTTKSMRQNGSSMTRFMHTQEKKQGNGALIGLRPFESLIENLVCEPGWPSPLRDQGLPFVCVWISVRGADDLSGPARP